MVDEFTLSLMLVEQGPNPTSAPFFGLQYFSKIIFTLAVECNKIVLHLLNPIFRYFLMVWCDRFKIIKLNNKV